MVLSNVVRVVSQLNSSGTRSGLLGIRQIRRKYTYRSGALKPMPYIIPFGLLGVVLTVIPGLLIGAAISRNMANFLEENDLFVPSDDDDDDD